MVCDNVVCVCDKVLCDRVVCVEDGVCVCVCVTKLYVTRCESWCVTKLCVKDGVWEKAGLPSDAVEPKAGRSTVTSASVRPARRSGP